MIRYATIAGRLKQLIVEGVYPPGAQLPSHRELALQFQTTLATLRKSIDLLTETGWLRVEHGLGTFVADIGITADVLVSFTDTTVEGAPALNTDLVDLTTGVRWTTAAHELGLLGDAPLVRIDRRRSADGSPVIYQSSYLSNEYAAEFVDYTSHTPLYVFLRERLRLIATTSREVVSVVSLSQRLAPLLDVDPGAPVLRSHKTSYADSGSPFLFDEALVVTDRMPLVVERAGLRSNVHFLSQSDRRRADVVETALR